MENKIRKRGAAGGGADHRKPSTLGYGILKKQGIIKHEINNENDALEKINVGLITTVFMCKVDYS